MPEVTVSMPAFNTAHYIGEAIRSVLAQDDVDFELIVLDDASEDKTAEVVNTFRDPRIRLLRNTHRRGISFCHNRILDESTSFKNQEADRYRALRLMRKYIYRITELTGTPVPNGLMDLWGQLYLLDRGQRLGSGIGDFRKRWFDPPDYEQFKWQIKGFAEAEIHSRVGDICMTLRAEDYLELPPVVYNYIRVGLTSSEQKKYDHFKRHAVMELKGRVLQVGRLNYIRAREPKAPYDTSDE